MRAAFVLAMALLVPLFIGPRAAHAEDPLEWEATGLVGSVLVTGDANPNEGDLQLGASGEVVWDGLVLGLRGTRTLRDGLDFCRAIGEYHAGNACPPLNARTIGADVGYEWDLQMLHFSPRLGVGYVDDTHGHTRAGYLEPGFVLSAQFAMFVFGMDVRYRASLGHDSYSGLVEYVRLGLRF